VCAADKSLCYGLFHSPATLLTWVVLCAPPVFPIFPLTVALWFFYFLCVVTVQDEFTLFNYVASFKTYCFVMCGVLPIFADFFIFYFKVSSRDITDRSLTTINDLHMDRTWQGSSAFFAWYGLLTNRAFIALWVVCWIVYARYLCVRSLHFKQEESGTGEHAGRQQFHHARSDSPPPQPATCNTRHRASRNHAAVESGKLEEEGGMTIKNAIHTGDEDTGDHEQTLLMKWDAIIIALHVVFGLCDLIFRMKITLFEAVFQPSREELLFETFICTTLSIFAAPFVLWKIPVVGELIHQMRPTGFDEAGGLRLCMSLADMKKKHEREIANPRRRVLGLGKSKGTAGAKQPAATGSSKKASGTTKTLVAPQRGSGNAATRASTRASLL
jgi:hypothetical protein